MQTDPPQYRTYQVRDPSGLVLALYTCREPSDWDDDMGLFHKNDSSWCSGNVFDACSESTLDVLQPEVWEAYHARYSKHDTCPCLHFSFELAPKA